MGLIRTRFRVARADNLLVCLPAPFKAVAILPILVSPNAPPQTILITQYRPPVDSFSIELPAGLIDEGEGPEEAAVRELKEETGYTGEVVKVTGLMVNDPGMISAVGSPFGLRSVNIWRANAETLHRT